MPNVTNNWKEWDEIEEGLTENEVRDKIKHKNSKTDTE